MLASPILALDLTDIANLDLEKTKDEFNIDAEKDPSWIMKNIVGDQKINVEIILKDGSTKIIGIETKDGQVTTIQPTPIENPTMEISVDEDKVQEMVQSGDPIGFLSENLGKDGMEIETFDFWTGFKIGVLNFILWFVSLFTTVGNFVKKF
jgi:hypothetical protein